ncbi:MAG: alpha/beta fold hydrolase [Steroidobacteraceae bacterium]
MIATRCIGLLMLTLAAAAGAATGSAAPDSATLPAAQQGDFLLRNFRFASGESLPELRLHYTTLGTPQRDAAGRVSNAVLILHGTGGDGQQFLRPQFAEVLLAPGGLLDAARYFIVLPDNIGHGHSSKPSDGLHAHFPQYAYSDMVSAQYRLLTEGLHINHLRLILGTSMGCMHAFMWGETYASFADALMPLACLPVQIAGRNRIWRRMIIDAIKNDPAWLGGEYRTPPLGGLRTAADLLMIAGSAPALWQAQFPDRDSADRRLSDFLDAQLRELDANDLLYQIAASRDYDPAARLASIHVPVMWVNSADDFINPPELGIAERAVTKLPHGKFVLLPVSERTHGHSTHTWAATWEDYLRELLGQSAGPGVK